MRFKELRRRRRRPKAPMFLLELDLAFDEVMADLVFPWEESAAGPPGAPNRLSRTA
jgi:hypothetical protein